MEPPKSTWPKTILAVLTLSGLCVYLYMVKEGEFPPPPGQVIGAIVGLAFWAVEQVLGLLPIIGIHVKRASLNYYWPTMSALFFGGTAYGISGGGVVEALLAAVAGGGTMRMDHRAGPDAPVLAEKA